MSVSTVLPKMLPGCLLLLSLSACGGKSNPDVPQRDTTAYAAPESHETGHDDPRDIPYTAEFNGRKYDFRIRRTPEDSLPQVKDRFGDPYQDNRVSLTIRRDGETLAHRSFTKLDFSGQIDAPLERLILGGLAFRNIDAQGLHFGLQFNAPGDEEGGWLYILTLPLDAKGSPTLVRDDLQDTSSAEE